MRPISCDYDDNPERWKTNVSVRRRFGYGDVHAPIAERIVAEGLRPVLDVGCGDGELARQLPPDWPWLGVDRSPTMLSRLSRPGVLGDATALPSPDAAFGAVAMLWMLYHLDDPAAALEEAKRVLRPGALLAVCTNSRFDSPELAHVWQLPQTTFDAELAPEMVAEQFGDVELDRWDAPLVHLPDEDAVRDYLVSRLMPPDDAAEAATRVEVPLDVTKRGVIVFARRLRP